MASFRTALAAAGIAVASALLATSAFAAQQPANSPAANEQELEEVVVTAQRREETLQKASISISVLSAQDIAKAGITQAQSLSSAVPGLQIAQGGAATQIYIRGIGDFGSTAGTNPAVAFNVDGVYVARPAGIEGNFYDLQRVEVLKGPQGTLYGRNATGGAINVVTQKPKLGVFETQGALEVGNYAKLSGEAAVNVPLGETFAMRASAQVVRRNPYVTLNFDDEVRQSGRLQFLWSPNEALSLRVAGDYTHVGGGGMGFVLAPFQPGIDPWTSGNDPVYTNYLNNLAVASNQCAPRVPGTPFAQFPYSGACPNLGPLTQAQLSFGLFGEQGKQDNVFWSASAQLDYDLGFATLTVLPAYRKAELDYAVYPGPGTMYDFSFKNGVPETSEATSVETRLANDSSALKWVLGAYYFKEDQLGYGHIVSGYVQNVLLKQELGTEAYAGFGQASFSLTDTLRLIAGARYTSDRRNVAPQSVLLPLSLGFAQAAQASGGACVRPVFPDVIGAGTVGCAGPVLLGEKTFTRFNWKAGVEYDVTAQNMVYATASTGFKAGGFYAGQNAQGTATSYDPEKVLAFEVGSRNRFLDNTLQFNAEAFYYDYDDHQEPVVTQDVTGSVVQAIQNAGSGRAYGANLDVIYRLTQNDTLHVGVEYLNTKYTEFGLSSPLIVGTPAFVPVGSTGCPVINTFTVSGVALPPTGVGVGSGPGGSILPGLTRGQVVGRQTLSCVGFPFTRAPELSGVASYAHKFGLGNGGNIEAQAGVQFASNRYEATDYLPVSNVRPYQTYDASLTYSSPDDKWSLSGFIRNISNEAVLTATSKSVSIVGLSSGSLAPPRTFGARVNFHF